MKIDKDGRITIEMEHEANTLYGVCIEIDKTGCSRTFTGEIHPMIRLWLDAKGETPSTPLDTFLIRGLLACTAWWMSKANAAKPLGRPYDDSM